MPQISIKPYLAVQRFGADVHIGTLPPSGLVVRDAPDYLAPLLEFLSEPRTEHERRSWSHDQGVDSGGVETVVAELIEQRVLSSKTIPQDRYGRHRLYFDLIGADQEAAQAAIQKSTVALLGVGGIGSNVAMALSGAGVGRLVLADPDIVERSNLTRQFLYTEADIQKPKVVCAASNLAARNPEVATAVHEQTISTLADVADVVDGCDFVVVSADSPASLVETVNRVCVAKGLPYSHAGYIESFGVVGPMVIPSRTACYECFRETGDVERHGGRPDEAERQFNGSFQAPSYGPLNQIVAAMQANEVLRHLAGMECRTASQRLLVDASDYSVHVEKFERVLDCGTCSDG